MEIEYSSHFARAYRTLSVSIQRKAERQEALFRKSPFDPRLQTHKLHGKLKDFYSFSIDRRYRIVFKFITPRKVIFLDAGDHAVYQ